MIARLLYRLSARLRCRRIDVDSGRYLERYFLGDHLGRTWYLHRFVRNDSERHLHNHPWRYGWSLILTGWYDEEGAVDVCPHAGPAGMLTEVHRRRWFNRIDGATTHRIVATRAETWTLVCHSGRQRLPDGSLKGWGFFESSGDATVFWPALGHARPPADYPLGKDADRAPFGGQ